MTDDTFIITSAPKHAGGILELLLGSLWSWIIASKPCCEAGWFVWSQLLQQFSASSGGSSESPAEEFLVSVQPGSGGHSVQILREFGVSIQTLPVSVVMGKAALSFQPALRLCPKTNPPLGEKGSFFSGCCQGWSGAKNSQRSFSNGFERSLSGKPRIQWVNRE